MILLQYWYIIEKNRKRNMANTPNEDQLKAINTTEGPVLIIAGPGSGKTFTLVERVCHLLIDLRVPPENILISTFTEKAARELVTRISNRIYEQDLAINVNSLCVGTMHSIFLNLLEEFREFTRLKRNYTIWDEFDQQYMIYKNIHEFIHIDEEKEITGSGSWWSRAGVIAGLMNKVSEESLNVEQLSQSGITSAVKLAKLYDTYEKLLGKCNALDFSKIQQEFLHLLEEHHEVTEKLQERFHYMMIDEYQDTNSIQERIIMKLLNKEQNICVVGDDDQGLYRFRGASVRNILEFPNIFQEGKCKKIELTKNYRSHSGIISFYNDWMKQQDWTGERPNQYYRFNKQVVSGGDLLAEGRYNSVVRVSAPGQKMWCDEVEKFLKDMKTSGVITDWNQVVFLFKSVQNDNAKTLAEHLEKNGIRVYAPRSNMFFDRDEIRIVIGAICTVYYEYFATNDFNDEFKYYMEGCISKFKDVLREDSDLKQFVREKLREQHSMTPHKGLDYAFSGLFYQLMQFPMFAQYLGNEAVGNIWDGRPARNLAKFSQLLTKFEYLENLSVFTSENIEREIKRFCTDYLCFLYDGGIEEYEDETEKAPSGSVSFMTIHQSKGLEFPVVFVCSLWDVPRKQYTELDELLQRQFYHKQPFEPIDEMKNFDFMRLYYTAYSRAQNLLCLSCPERDKGQQIPSKLFKKSYNSIPDWRAWTRDEISQIKLETVKKSNVKNEYSFTSNILLYENCPMQYKFFKELGFAPVRQGTIVFGTLVHQTIEDIHKAVIRGQPELVTADNIANWLNKNYENLKQAQHVYLAEPAIKSAIKQVQNYAEHEKNNWSRIKEAEVDVSFIEQDYILKGKVDLIRNDNGHVDIVDFKSEKKPDINSKIGREHLEQYKRQLQIYAHIIEGKYGEKVDNMHLYYTNAEDENPYISFARNDLAIAQTIDKVSDVVHKIERKDYSMERRVESQCGNCDMRYYCNLYWCVKSTKND